MCGFSKPGKSKCIKHLFGSGVMWYKTRARKDSRNCCARRAVRMCQNAACEDGATDKQYV